MKQGWKTDTIDSLCEQMNGIWKGTKEPFVTAKILRTTNFSKDCQMKLDDLAIIEVEQKKMDKRRLKKGRIFALAFRETTRSLAQSKRKIEILETRDSVCRRRLWVAGDTD